MTCAVVIVDHGSTMAEAQCEFEAIVEAFRTSWNGGAVLAAHLAPIEPTLAAAVQGAIQDGIQDIIIVPFFLGTGRHVAVDLPAQVEDLRSIHCGCTFAITPHLGRHAGVSTWLQEIVESAIAERT